MKREAEDSLAEALNAIRLGECVEPSTHHTYRVAANRMTPHVGNVKLQELKPIQVERLWGSSAPAASHRRR